MTQSPVRPEPERGRTDRHAPRAATTALLFATAALLAAGPLASAAAAQAPRSEPHPPPYYAITNARIVTVAGPVIEGGTVVIANGLIRAVGTDVDVPPEAWVIDGTGLTVYPGLIDALSDLGLQGGDGGEGGGRGAGGAPGAPGGRSGPSADGPEDRPATYSWRAAADLLSVEDSRVETWREGGFTSALSVPSDGIVTGQAALVNLRSGDPDEPNEMVVRAPVALRLNLEGPGGFRSFPGALFGVISYLEQLFIDAEWYARAQAANRARPAGLERPAYDRTLDPVGRAVSERWPVLIPAENVREIRRALELGGELGVRTVVYGGDEGYAVAEELKAAGTPVLVSLDWPERSKDVDPEDEESLRSLRTRAWAPSTPKALYDAGVPFAFYSDGVGAPREALKAVRAAIDAGLPADAALRALTLGPAEIYGVADRLGSIERGKIANLVVTDGDLFDEKTKVKMVFVDGQKFEKREAARPEEAPATDLTGAWALTVETPRGAQESTAELEMAEDGTLSGTIRSERGEGTITDGWVSGERFSFTVSLTMGGRSVEASYTGTVEGDELEGSVSFGRFSSEFRGTRKSGPEASASGASASGGSAKGGSAGGPSTDGGWKAVALAGSSPFGPALTGGGSEAPADAAPTRQVSQVGAAAEPVPAAGPMRQTVDWGSPAPTTLIRNATILTVTNGTIENGSILVRNGKIAAVGTDISAPGDATVIDASGRYVTPGIIDAHSHIAADAINEGSIAVSSMVRIEDVLDPTDINIYREAAGGVTTSHVMHGSANPIGGQNAVIKHRWGQDVDGLLFEGAPPTIKFALGENPKRSNFNIPGEPRYPGTRMGVMDVIRRAFVDAREYQRAWQEYRSSDDENRVPPKRDLKLEPLVEILEGKRLVHSHSYRADEILQLMRLAEEFGFRIAVFQHVLEGYKVADELAEHGAGASTFSDWWAYKVEAYDAIPYNAALMTRRGVVVSINSDSPEEGRHLNQEAGKTRKWGGLSEQEALALVTLNPAKQLRVDDRVGSIERGKDADLVIWENHPLSVYSKALTTMIDGRIVFDVERDRARQERIAAEKKALQEKLGEAEAEDEERVTEPEATVAGRPPGS